MKICFRLRFAVALLATLGFFIADDYARGQSVPFTVSFWYPTNGQSYLAPATVGVHARVLDSNVVKTVQYFNGANSIGIVSNTSGVVLTNSTSDNPFYLAWSNVQAGAYTLTAVATDSTGATATSAPVTINVTNPPPPRPAVYLYSPTNNSKYHAPANVTIYARAVETGGTIASVTFEENSKVLGVVTNSMVYSNISTEPLYIFPWTNVPAGAYALTAIATDAKGNSSTSTVVNITVTNPPPPIPFTVSFYYPTNGQSYLAPANVGMHALVLDSNVVRTVQYFNGTNSIGIVTNTGTVLLTNSSQGNPFEFTWSNVMAGVYSLTAVATDSSGALAVSAPVKITVTNPPPPVPYVYIYSPTNNAKYVAPANLMIYARAFESGGNIASVTFLVNSNILGIVSNSMVYSNISTEPFYAFSWTNVPAGADALTAIVTDANGATVTSTVVNISVTNPPPPVPFTVSFFYPTNGQTYVAPANIGVHALVLDSNVVKTMQYFANGASIGMVSNTSGVVLTSSTAANPFFLLWSNVPAGAYALTAVATDTMGATATSAPVNIWVLSTPPPVVTIYAPDPVAVEGANASQWYVPISAFTNYYTGSNTATFLVRRSAGTNVNLTVNYSIGGTATNGVDYATIASNVTILAGHTYALVTITPLIDNDTNRAYDTVVLTLQSPPLSTNTPPPYSIGSPASAGAVILEENMMPLPKTVIHSFPDGSVHISLPATDGLNASVQTSTDLINWQLVCTNTVIKGSSQYVDPSPGATAVKYYRIVIAPAVPSY